MAALHGQSELVKRFIRTLGLDPSKTRSVIVSMRADSVVILEVEMYANGDDLENLGTELKHFELVEKKKDE